LIKTLRAEAGASRSPHYTFGSRLWIKAPEFTVKRQVCAKRYGSHASALAVFATDKVLAVLLA
jgi:hypothetical protein